MIMGSSGPEGPSFLLCKALKQTTRMRGGGNKGRLILLHENLEVDAGREKNPMTIDVRVLAPLKEESE